MFLFTAIADTWIVLCAISFVIVSIDLWNRQLPMTIMKVIWPLTTLYLGPIAAWSYWTMERPFTGEGMHAHHDHMGTTSKPFWQSVFVSATHCGGGCALGDAVGELWIFASGFTVAGSVLLTSYAVEFVLAYVLGIAFQYLAIAPMSTDRVAGILRSAVEADSMSLVAFEVGMFAFMAFSHYTFPGLTPASPVFWFMMQLAMIAGFVTTYPANWFLVQRGVKHAM